MRRGLIAILIVAVLGGAAIFLGRGEAPSSPAPAPAQPAPALLMPVKIVFDCTKDKDKFSENCKITDKKDGFVLMRPAASTEGHEIRFIQVTPEWPKDLKDLFAAVPADDLPGKAVYEFEVPRDDTYYVNLRAKWVDTCGNSVWVKIDDGAYIAIKDEIGQITKTSYCWDWHQVQQGGQPKGFALKKGRHTLAMSVRQNGPALHRWAITTEASALLRKDEE